jgi:hypothetical protein
MSRRNRIVGQFIPRPTAMHESPAYRQLSLSGHRVLGRVECEHGRHGGVDNGNLPVTFADFEAYGIDRHAIAPAIRECVALGFLEITQRGRSGNGEFRSANKFRLTYIVRRGLPATNEWQRITSEEEAKRIALAARASPHGDIDSGGETPTVKHPRSSGENPHRHPRRQGGKPTLVEVINPHWDSEFGTAVPQ